MKKISLKQLIIFLLLVGLILSIPSIVYLVFHNGNIDNFDGQNYYFLDIDSFEYTIAGTIIFGAVIVFSFLFYLLILKKSNEFKNIKTIILVVFVVGLMFMICLPNTSTDIFYYMGTGRLFQKYGENPYYTTVSEFLSTGINDSILEHTGYWANTVVLYGPLWTIICATFSLFSFGNNTILLYIYKLMALIVHIATCYIVYKVTEKKKFALMYGLNPFLIMEFLVNVHNDLYLVFFVMLGIYFLKKKNNIWLALLSLTCSILIKYVTVIIIPFLVLYYLRDKNKKQKILYCALYAIFVIAIVLIFYMLFFNNFLDLFEILKSQQGKIKESIYLLMLGLGLDDYITSVNGVCVAILMYCMILYIVVGIFKRENFLNYMDDTKNVLLILIFGVLTNFTAWYLSWLFIPIYWLKSKHIKSILFLQFLFECSYVYLCYVHSDAIKYEVMILPTILIIMVIRKLIIMIKQRGENLHCKKTKSLL